MQSPTPKRFLFVGNSLTFWNKGIPFHFEQLVLSFSKSYLIETDEAVKGGASLKKLWEIDSPDVRKIIKEGEYDIVVLQEDLPETDIDSFHTHARKFIATIRETGAEPVLFMAWPYERLGWITLEALAQAHWDIAAERGIAVAPVGLAWQRAVTARPELEMYDADREHPSLAGTYLAVQVIYATVFRRSPVGLAYLPSGDGTKMTEADAAFLQRIAWETVQAYPTPP